MFNLTKTTRNLNWREVKRFKQILQLTSFRKFSSESVNDGNRTSRSESSLPRKYIKRGPGLEYFLVNGSQNPTTLNKDLYSKEKHPYISEKSLDGTGKKGNITIFNFNKNELTHILLMSSLHRSLWVSNECK